MLGIPTVRDRVVQAALKLVLEPIFEADFLPCSYGFRPGRRAQDAIAEIHVFASPPHGYEWVVEGDIQACFDEIDHAALMGRVRQRIADKRVLALVKAFLKAGILNQDGGVRDTITGTPQGGILSPLLANIALSVLDEHLAGRQRTTRAQRRRGQPSVRLIRYADDWVVLVRGTRAHAETLRDEAATALASMGLRLSAAKTRICHLDEGFDFLGFRIQRQPKRGAPGQHAVYTWPSKKALVAVKAKVRALTRAGSNQPLAALLGHLNRVLRGWTSLLPLRGVQAHLRLPGPVHLEPGPAMAAPQAPTSELGVATPPLPTKVVADPRHHGAAALRARDRDPLPATGRADPNAMDGDGLMMSNSPPARAWG
jgi:RNA-directed DNA polymerase